MKALDDCTIGIVGLGLIGGSLARGLRAANPNRALLASDTCPQSLARAIEDGTVNAALELDALCSQADLIVLALPPVATAEALPRIAALTDPATVVTDVASVKTLIADGAAQLGEEFCRRFVPGHPIAGSERSGYEASRADLFQSRKVILAPLTGNDGDAVNLVHALWRSVGADVLGMTLDSHDQVLAATSHLPHLLAYAIVDVLAGDAQRDDIFRYAAGGFADFSRLASSDARMWSDIFISNAGAVLEVLDAYSDNLQRLKALIEGGQRESLQQLFAGIKKIRDQFMVQHYKGEPAPDSPQEDITYRVRAGGSANGSFRVPGDKSISHRTIMLGAIADGVTRVSGFLEGEDALNTVAAFREMGVTIVGPDRGELVIYGVGKHGLQPPRKPLYMGNSGTAMRLLAGLLAAQEFDSELTGDESLSHRPMGRVADPLRQMGARIETADDGTPPLRISGSPLRGQTVDMAVASAQVKSCLLLAGLYAHGTTEIVEPAPCRDHTERMLRGFGYPLTVQGPRVSLEGGHLLQATTIEVPADISSAAFFMVAAAITPDSNVELTHVGINPTRMGIINLLRAMGSNIELHNEVEVGGEPVADIRVRYSPLQGITIPHDQIPLAIDEFPALFIAAACAQGDTVLRGAEELRVKESDRLAAMADGLTSLGIEVENYDDGIRIQGGTLGSGEIDSQGDHRIAMAFSVAALRASGPVIIRHCANVATSFPGFVRMAGELGLQISEETGPALE